MVRSTTIHVTELRVSSVAPIQTRGEASDVMLSVEDNGAGFDASGVNGGMGLRNMRERAEALPGGWFRVESEKGKGAHVTAGAHTLQQEGGHV